MAYLLHRQIKESQMLQKKSPKAHGFYYCNNKTAWMTLEFFEE
jgi:hypothetical protein